MAIDPNLLSAIRASLWGAASLGYNKKAQSANAYEAYTMSLVVAAARGMGWSVAYENGRGNRVTSRLKFRTSSGYIHRGARFTHVVIRNSDPRADPLELHVGVRMRGYSGVDHEADVGVLPRPAASRARL